ncbi:hypothetical protein GIB67_014328 [Kingdonia uniflora]|uniref:Uncharacterized protein n=1 Tax=Kingdonia uniflora TaxID=39325 RepID=A0A7J7NU13_9MAGN|nr:hypothetical protein GIB67_014328 [Kingdonia uniflora]
MSCAVAVANSPVFSPSRVSLFCKTSSSSSSGSTDVSSSSRSPFRVRVQKSSPSGLGFGFFKGEVVESSSSLSSPINSSSSSSAVLKRKRPMRIDIPVAPLNFTGGAVKVPGVMEVEVEREGFSVYCKKGGGRRWRIGIRRWLIFKEILNRYVYDHFCEIFYI